MHSSQRPVDLALKASLQLLHTPIVDDDPTAVRAGKLFDVIKLRIACPLEKLPRWNGPRISERAQGNRNVGDEEQKDLRPEEVRYINHIQLCAVGEYTNARDGVD